MYFVEDCTALIEADLSVLATYNPAEYKFYQEAVKVECIRSAPNNVFNPQKRFLLARIDFLNKMVSRLQNPGVFSNSCLNQQAVNNLRTELLVIQPGKLIKPRVSKKNRKITQPA